MGGAVGQRLLTRLFFRPPLPLSVPLSGAAACTDAPVRNIGSYHMSVGASAPQESLQALHQPLRMTQWCRAPLSDSHFRSAGAG